LCALDGRYGVAGGHTACAERHVQKLLMQYVRVLGIKSQCNRHLSGNDSLASDKLKQTALLVVARFYAQ